jgi:hypothetical protein
MSGQLPPYPPDPYGRRRPLDYRTPPPQPSTGRTVLRVLFWIFVALVVGFFLLLGTCYLAMRR